jgi:hypothetical protein
MGYCILVVVQARWDRELTRPMLACSDSSYWVRSMIISSSYRAASSACRPVRRILVGGVRTSICIWGYVTGWRLTSTARRWCGVALDALIVLGNKTTNSHHNPKIPLLLWFIYHVSVCRIYLSILRKKVQNFSLTCIFLWMHFLCWLEFASIK